MEENALYLHTNSQERSLDSLDTGDRVTPTFCLKNPETLRIAEDPSW
jgi:hypothetical protein